MTRTLLLCALVAAIALAGSAYAWPHLGPVVPIHFGLGGQADGFAPKGMGLLLLPAMALFTPFLIAGILRLDPRKDHIEASMPALRTVLVSTSVFLAFVHGLVLHAALGNSVLSERAMFVAMGALFVAIGSALPGLRSNYFAGIRTPWTLQSERVWDRTHRVAGRAFAAAGIVVILAGLLLPAAWALALSVVALLVGSMVPVVLSYVYWKDERAATR
jgi:uncharacterized membrane protein